MSDAAVIVPGLDTLSVASGAPAAAAGAAPGGGFAGVLAERMQGAHGADNPPPTAAQGAVPAAGRGEASPPMGKPLPVEPVTADGEPTFLAALPLETVPAVGVESGLSVTLSPLPVSAAGVVGIHPNGQTQATEDSAALPLTPSRSNSALTVTSPVTTPVTNPLPSVAANVASATHESAAASSVAPVGAPLEATAANPLQAVEAHAASRESRLPDWQALRMARAAGLDSRPAVAQAMSLNKQDGADSGDSQDFLQLLGMRPIANTAATLPANADGGRPLMSFMAERFPGEGQMASLSTLLSGTEVDAAGAFSSTLARTTASPGIAALPTLSVASPVGQGSWSQDMGQRVTWLANQEIREAQIQLNPRHLGPVEVRIAFGQEQQLNVSFVAHHPQAREALDAMLPRLREMFDSQGLNLANVNVSQESFTERRRDYSTNPNAPRGYAGAGDAIDELDIPPPIAMATGLFDAYA